jgi:hypothetical protein
VGFVVRTDEGICVGLFVLSCTGGPLFVIIMSPVGSGVAGRPVGMVEGGAAGIGFHVVGRVGTILIIFGFTTLIVVGGFIAALEAGFFAALPGRFEVLIVGG